MRRLETWLRAIIVVLVVLLLASWQLLSWREQDVYLLARQQHATPCCSGIPATALDQFAAARNATVLLDVSWLRSTAWFSGLREWLPDATKPTSEQLCDVPADIVDFVRLLCKTPWEPLTNETCRRMPCKFLQPPTKRPLPQCGPTAWGGSFYLTNDVLALRDSPSLILEALSLYTAANTHEALDRFRTQFSSWAIQQSYESLAYYPVSRDAEWRAYWNNTYGYDRQIFSTWVLDFMKRVSPETLRAAPLPVDQKIAAAMWMQSNCEAISKRRDYIEALMQVFPVHSMGGCLKNTEIPPEAYEAVGVPVPVNVSRWWIDWEGVKEAAMRRYKFMLSFENSYTHDYVTEKFWGALLSGSLMVYMGPENAADWFPCDHCIIHARDFSGPEDLAKHLHHLNTNDTAYNEYFAWKEKPLRPSLAAAMEAYQRNNESSSTWLGCDILRRAEAAVIAALR